MRTVTPEQVACFRLERHFLADRAHAGAIADPASAVCGLQAQVLAAARRGVWARVCGVVEADVDAALYEDRSLVKVWAMRGTLHVLASRDLDLFVAALRSSHRRDVHGPFVKLGFEPREVDDLTEAIIAALKGKTLTRRELAAQVDHPRAGVLTEQEWGMGIRPAVREGQVCFGPQRGAEATFARVDDWLGARAEFDAREATAELARRYLRTYAPANHVDFGYWSGMSAADARSAWKAIADELATVEVAGLATSLLRDDLDALLHGRDGAEIRMIPLYDSFLLGHKDKAHLVDPAYYKSVYQSAGRIAACVLRGGRVAGTWSAERRGRRLQVTVQGFSRFDPADRAAIEAESASLGAFVGAEAALVFTD